MADSAAGTKRKASTSGSASKRQETSGAPKQKQKTLEESLPNQGDDAPSEENEDEGQQSNDVAEDNTQDAQEDEAPKDKPEHANGDDHKRDEEVPSTILEKGILYFFFRARVGIDEPQSVQDVARSYMVLRPLPLGAQLGDDAIEDVGNNRLLALPKKVLPVSHRDRFMTFVEKANTTVQDLKDNFMAGSDYDTKTTGTRHTPAVTPAGEGVYAITTTGRETHLAYILTIPSELSEVQKALGLRERGSFVTSAKNPQVGGPSYANLPKGAEFSKEIFDEFRGRGWMPLQPKVLDYENAQFLLIGEGIGELGKATEPSTKDQQHDKEAPKEEMEKLAEEDEHRAAAVEGDDTIFEDLGLSAKNYPKLQTTW
ncbi:MAG: hypothetical protein M4579_003125 [Chaenotheca gracillima]|nr:MAG: hypothetical protein M4579_003125 [Chaenotheca gracillima]